jgi:hypothetical protein
MGQNAMSIRALRATHLVLSLASACGPSTSRAVDSATHHSAAPQPPPPPAASSKRQAPLDPTELADYQRGCTADRDCSLVSNGCCGCEGSGYDVGLLRGKVAEFKALFVCSDVPCPTMYNPECERQRAVCRAGRCDVELR